MYRCPIGAGQLRKVVALQATYRPAGYGGAIKFQHRNGLGVFNYLIHTGDKAAFEKWMAWIKANPRIYSPLPSYCTHKECVFKAIDCPIFITVAAAFGKATDALLVCNPLDGINIPSPNEVVKQFEELLGKLTDAGSRYESSLRRLIDQAASALGFPKVDALLPSIADARAAFDLSTFATLAGPHNEGFDCHVNSLLKVDAAGNFHAFSMSVSDRVTDERTASWLTLVSLTIRLAPPAKVISATPANNEILAVRLIS